MQQTTMQQLDIFADSHDVMLRNDVLAPLQRRDATAARTALALLAAEYPDDGALPAMTVLVRELESTSTAPFADRAALANARQHLEDVVTPAARRVLPAQAVQPWLVPCWRALAARAASLAFRATEADSHAAPLWLLAGDGAAAIDAVEGIESWWRVPAPLAWMTEARYRTGGLDAAWPLLAELAWLAPVRFAALLPRLGDALLDVLRRRFDAEFSGAGEVDDYAWFPAWLLVVKPALAGRLSEARVQRDQAASRAMALLGEILRREHQGDQHELIGLRQEFSRLHAPLFEVYMATRQVQHR
ncbi:hypothetical protein [Paraburkholderia diazotrophica]|uniref:Uncharacterized protein n=1 Tax=Paraburkholderia diazotrophica TaxID=667676 RepID=A0A1H7CNU9_9BURK|nr:hypothetical protein [Paraburkholderia diazotrophica]SEJ90904.1 hypothetical protein SAMN05192539_102312 [Paraburkholderia diazotrophica]